MMQGATRASRAIFRVVKGPFTICAHLKAATLALGAFHLPARLFALHIRLLSGLRLGSHVVGCALFVVWRHCGHGDDLRLSEKMVRADNAGEPHFSRITVGCR